LDGKFLKSIFIDNLYHKPFAVSRFDAINYLKIQSGIDIFYPLYLGGCDHFGLLQSMPSSNIDNCALVIPNVP